MLGKILPMTGNLSIIEHDTNRLEGSLRHFFCKRPERRRFAHGPQATPLRFLCLGG